MSVKAVTVQVEAVKVTVEVMRLPTDAVRLLWNPWECVEDMVVLVKVEWTNTCHEESACRGHDIASRGCGSVSRGLEIGVGSDCRDPDNVI